MIKNLFLKAPANAGLQKHQSAGSQLNNIVKKNSPTMQNAVDNQNDNSVTRSTHKKAISVGVLGAKGGVGASTVALNLAIALSNEGKNVTLIDANLQQPDITVMLGREAENSMLEFFSRSQTFEEKVFSACSLNLNTDPRQGRCSLLSAPANGEAGTQSNLSEITAGLNPLIHQNDFVIVDLPKNLDKHLVTIMDKLDFIVVIYESNLAAVAACRRWLKIFIELGYNNNKTILVQNRAGAHGSIKETDSQQLLPAGSRVKIPNAYNLIESSAALGQAAIAKEPKHKFSQAIFELAKSLKLQATEQK